MKALAITVLLAAVLLGSLVLRSQELSRDGVKRDEDKTIFERLRDTAASLGSSLREGIEARKQARTEGRPATESRVNLDKTHTTVVRDPQAHVADELLEKADQVRCATCEKIDEAREAGVHSSSSLTLPRHLLLTVVSSSEGRRGRRCSEGTRHGGGSRQDGEREGA